MRPQVHPQAHREIRALLKQLAQRSPAAASRLRRKLAATLRLLGVYPERGRMLRASAPWFRQIVVESFIVYYVLGEDRQVLIVDVVHGALVTEAPERAAQDR